MEYVTRINLKTKCADRKELINFCLGKSNQCLAIGWSCVYKNNVINGIDDFYKAVYNSLKNDKRRINHVINVFSEVKINDLFWTRDENGYYWICRAINMPKSYCDVINDIGAILPVEAFRVGLEVPGQLKSSFNRPNGGTAHTIRDKDIINYSKYCYNIFSNTELYKIDYSQGDILNNLPPLDLEELIFSYLQIKYNYYFLYGSIASKSTTIKIEGMLVSKDIKNPHKAVLQVKGGTNKTIDALDYKVYTDDGYYLYLYAPHIINLDKIKNCTRIYREDILNFYYEYKSILPESITRWEKLIAD